MQGTQHYLGFHSAQFNSIATTHPPCPDCCTGVYAMFLIFKNFSLLAFKKNNTVRLPPQLDFFLVLKKMALKVIEETRFPFEECTGVFFFWDLGPRNLELVIASNVNEF